MTNDTTSPSQISAVLASQPFATTPRARPRELSPKTMWLTAVVIGVLTAGAVVVLWWPATRGLNGADLVSARLDALKVGLSVAVGSGGVVALYLSWRRQRSTEADLDNRERALIHQQEVHAATMAHQNLVLRNTEYDAAQRRLNELYLKAVEQLGSPQAAVRHGGLYALERVAQDNPRQRQTVVNVICAYLRNPYTPPPDSAGRRPLGVRRPLLKSTERPRALAAADQGGIRETQLQEREVRLTAQRILHQHLQPGGDPDHPRHDFWPDIDIDLTGAILIYFSLTDCRIANATFRGATFTGVAWFSGAEFGGPTRFDGGEFCGDAGFGEAKFRDKVWFDEAEFGGLAWFGGAEFGGLAGFGEAKFSGNAGFGEAKFNGEAWFGGAEFGGPAGFDGAEFRDRAGFDEAEFRDNAGFGGVEFGGEAWFGKAKFGGEAWFGKVKFGGETEFGDATFSGPARFGEAKFDGPARFDRANFGRDAQFDRAVYDGRAFDSAEHGVPQHANDPVPDGGSGPADRY